ncbi:high mobility group box, partial [Obba rivulosa]
MRGSKPKDEHVKKPSNAFMLYRSEKVAEIVEQYPEYKKEQARLSKVVGQIWQEEPDDVKARFIEMAREEKRVFELANPGFKYGP